MYSTENARQVAEQLNRLLQSSDLRFEKFNVQFLGNDSFENKIVGGVDDDFINPYRLIKMPLNYRRVLNYIYYNRKYSNNKLRKLTIKTIAQELHLCEKTVSKAIHFLIDNDLIKVEKKIYTILNLDIKDNVDYIYISDIWKTISLNFTKEIDGKVTTINRRLTPREVLSLSVLSRHYSHAKEGNYYESSQRRLATYLNCSPTAIGDCLRNFENGGLVRRMFFKDGNGYDTLGVNNDWLTSYVVNDGVVDLAKKIKEKATPYQSERKSSKQNKDERSMRERIIRFTLRSDWLPSYDKVEQYAIEYLNDVKKECEYDFAYQELNEEKASLMDRFNRGEINSIECGKLFDALIHRQRAYLASKGLPRESLELQYQKRRAKRYIVHTMLRPQKSSLANKIIKISK